MVKFTRTVKDMNFKGDIIDQVDALDPPPGDEAVNADGTGPVSFSNITLAMKHTVARLEDWSVDVVIGFSSACGSIGITFSMNLSEGAFCNK